MRDIKTEITSARLLCQIFYCFLQTNVPEIIKRKDAEIITVDEMYVVTKKIERLTS